MNPHLPTPFSSSRGPENSFEDTLRLLAQAPVPEGLTHRVQAVLHTPPQAGRLLAWPARPNFENGWMRAAAAAAIVFVVAGGGWGIYSRVQPAGMSKNLAAPPRAMAPGGFSSAGAVRTPQTLNGPVLTHPATLAPQPVRKTSEAAAKDNQAPASRTKTPAIKKSPVPSP